MQSFTKSNLFIASCYAGILALGMLAGPQFLTEKAVIKGDSASFISSGKEEKVEQVLDIIKDNYVDPVKVDTLQNLGIGQILSHLDPHSSYLPPIKAHDLSQDLEGNYNGIGIEYFLLKDTITVSAVNERGPAAGAGIKAGDKILKIDGRSVSGTTASPEKIISMIKGRKSTSVELLVRRPGNSQDQLLHVKRDKIMVSSIDASYIIAPGVGYVKLSKFGAHTDDDFGLELTKLKKNGLKSLILDLRHNGGGYLNAATALADEFLQDKKLIVYTKGRHEPRTDYYATADGVFEQGKLILLIDENTASASEIVAGALQDFGRALIIGRRSFGKGLVQEQFNFGDGSALNLTIARYYTPLGRSIQRPYKMSADEYFEEPLKRVKTENTNAGADKDSIYKQSHAYKTSAGKTLYDGGGITPDIYVSPDTLSKKDFYYALRGRGLLNEFFFSQVLREKRPEKINDILDKPDLSEDQYQALIAIAAGHGLKAKGSDAVLSKAAINNDFRAFLARYYFGDEGYYRVLNSGDKVIARSLQELKQP